MNNKQFLQSLILYISLVPLPAHAMDNLKKRFKDDRAQQNYQRKKQKLFDPDQDLLTAIEKGEYEKVTQLLDGGANPNQKDCEFLTTPLHEAAEKRYNKIIMALINAGANIHAKSRVGATPLHFAVVEGHTDTVELLIQQGAYVQAKSWGYTPLHQAVNAETTKALLDAGANPQDTDGFNQTPLHHAAFPGRFSQSTTLLSHMKLFLAGLPDTIFMENNTVDAIKEEYLGYIKELCTTKDTKDKTACDIAKERYTFFPQKSSYNDLINLLVAINSARNFEEIPNEIRIEALKNMNNFMMKVSATMKNVEMMEID